MNQAQNNEDGVFHLEMSVFPLLDVKKVKDDASVTVEYKGTCFLITIGPQHVFVTAKHLLQEVPDKYNLYINYNTPTNQPSLLKISSIYANNLSEDISFFLPSPQMKKAYNNNLIPMKPLKSSLPIDQKVLVYGFPNSGQQDVNNDIPQVNIQRTRYEGKVIGIEKDCPFPRMTRVYQLDFPAPHGISGAPVMVVHNKAIVVAGFIIGEKTTNGKPYAIATDFTPFEEIEKLLIDASRKLASEKK